MTSPVLFTLAEVEALLFSVGNPESDIVDGNPKEDSQRIYQRAPRIGFRARSEKEILNDGYKWRKYGKKAIKNSQNPRNYYRCSVIGCAVKKKVQRDSEDPSYVVTMYDGVHCHEIPGVGR